MRLFKSTPFAIFDTLFTVIVKKKIQMPLHIKKISDKLIS